MAAITRRARSRNATRAGVLTAVTAVALGVFGAGMAAAADKSLTFKGAFPLIGQQSVHTVVHVNIPAKATPGQALTVPFSIDVDAGKAAGDGLRLVGAKNVAGTIKSSVTLKASDGRTVPLPIELPIPKTAVPPQGALTFAAKGSVRFTVPKGVAAGAAKTSVDATATTHVVTDSSLGQFDVKLTLDPAGQDTVLGSTQVG